MLNMANEFLCFPAYCSIYLLEQLRWIICQKDDFAFPTYELFPLLLLSTGEGGRITGEIRALMKHGNLHRLCLQEVLRLYITLLWFIVSFERQTIEYNTSGLWDFLEYSFFCSNIRDEVIPNIVLFFFPSLQPFLYSASEDHQVFIYRS